MAVRSRTLAFVQLRTDNEWVVWTTPGDRTALPRYVALYNGTSAAVRYTLWVRRSGSDVVVWTPDVPAYSVASTDIDGLVVDPHDSLVVKTTSASPSWRFYASGSLLLGVPV